ncbi:MAG: hypothetical protein R3F61_03225 [Myxococcota bacterium]
MRPGAGPSGRSALLLLGVLTGCGGPVTWECTFTSSVGGVPDSGTYSDGEMDCAAARSSGFQALAGEQSDCEQALLGQGADEAVCTCQFVDRSSCGGAWND